MEAKTRGQIDDKLMYADLFCIYKGLLTERKRKICELYYLNDLTFREIAKEQNVSFQAVGDCIKNSRDKLDVYEKSLKMREYINNTLLIKKQIEKLDIHDVQLDKLLKNI